MSINSAMNKQSVYIYTMQYFSAVKKKCSNMDESHRRYTKRKEARHTHTHTHTRTHTYIYTYMWLKG